MDYKAECQKWIADTMQYSVRAHRVPQGNWIIVNSNNYHYGKFEKSEALAWKAMYNNILIRMLSK